MEKYEIFFPVFPLNMPLNKNGEGPADTNEIVSIQYEIWDQTNCTIKTFINELSALIFCCKWNEILCK